ncbi:MAG: sialidase family protein [Planctomycetota bacterium]
MKTNIVGIIAGTIGLCFLGAGNESEVPNEAQTHDQAKTISWDQKTLTLIAEWGTYGRMIRLTSGNILCAFARRGTVWTSRSIDEGKTWNAPAMAVTYEFGAATNPEILELVDGWILLSYNERPRDGKNHFAIRTCLSKDAGETWTAHSIVYEADTHWENGCWEPAQIQLPSGQIQLYFANENPYRYSNEQEISMVRSEDNGLTWSKPTTISFRAHHRDGMPVPLILSNGKGIVVAIEDNALHGKFRPAIVCTSMKCNWNQPYVDGSSPQRWWALAHPPSPNVNVAAPYIRQFPSGETILSCQTNEGCKNPIMAVYLGNDEARSFSGKTVPFNVDPGKAGKWNSLFIKSATTVTAISGTTINGVTGLWAIDGQIMQKNAEE